MGSPGRPRKQKPWRPGAPAPIQAAGCGGERRLAVRQPERPRNRLRLTPTGWMPDLLGTWHHRKKKRSSLPPGVTETIINDRQLLAGRAIERMIDALSGARGKLSSFDLTVPMVDQSFRHRLGGDVELRTALDQVDELLEHLGPRDLKFVMSVLGGMGIHGAMLFEAGYEWRLKDGDAAAAIHEICAGAGPLTKGGAYKIIPKFAVPDVKSGSFEVEDRQRLEALGRSGKIDLKHKLPNENGFPVDDHAEIKKTAQTASRDHVSDNKADIEFEARRDELANIRGLKDPESKARRDELESRDDLVDIFEVVTRALQSRRHPDEDADPDTEAMREMHRKNPPPCMAGHGDVRDANSIGETDGLSGFADTIVPTTRQRAIDAFGIRACELGSLRFRALLSKIADFLEGEAMVEPPQHASAPAQITQRNDVPFDAGTFEDATFTELEPIAVSR
jgi:hypothetical protein